MSDHKMGITLKKDGVIAKGAAESLHEWRDAQKKVLRRIEDLIAEAHGIKQPDDELEEENSGFKSLREHIKELSEMTLSPRLTGK